MRRGIRAYARAADNGVARPNWVYALRPCACIVIHFVTAIDVLVGIGWLSRPLVDEWRQGRVEYLEGVASVNLQKISVAGPFCRVFRSVLRLQGREAEVDRYYRDPFATYRRYPALKDELRQALEGGRTRHRT